MKQFVFIILLFVAGCSLASTKQSYSLQDVGQGVNGGFIKAPSSVSTHGWTVNRGASTQPASKRLRYKITVKDGGYVVTPIGE